VYFICPLENTYYKWRTAVGNAWTREPPIIYYNCFSAVRHNSNWKRSIKVHFMFASQFCLLLSSRVPTLSSRFRRSTFAPSAGIVWRATCDGQMERSESTRIRPRYGWRCPASSNVFGRKIAHINLCLLLQIQIYHPHSSTPTWLSSGRNNWWEQWLVFIGCFYLKIIKSISAFRMYIWSCNNKHSSCLKRNGCEGVSEMF
jgi:hypothetical protein